MSSETVLMYLITVMDEILTASSALWIGFTLLMAVMAIAVKTFRSRS
jgi:hypothetical protein